MNKKNLNIKISPHFGFVFLCVFLFTILSIGICIWISIFSNPTELQKELFKVCLVTWQILISAILGLIAGKSL